MTLRGQTVAARKTIVATWLLLGAVLCGVPVDDGAGERPERRTAAVAKSACPVPDANCSGEIARRVMREAWVGARAQGRVAAQ
jgi:hypothetical protein